MLKPVRIRAFKRKKRQARITFINRRSIKKNFSPIDHQRAISLCQRYESYCDEVIEVLMKANQANRLLEIFAALEKHVDRHPIMNQNLWIHRDFFKYLHKILSSQPAEKPY